MRRPHLPHSCRVSWKWWLKYLRNCVCPIICWKETCKLIAWLCTVTITCQNDLKTKKSSSGLLCFLWSGFGEVTSLCRWLLSSLQYSSNRVFPEWHGDNTEGEVWASQRQLAISSCCLPICLDGVHEASIRRHSEQTGPPFEIRSQKQVSLLLDSIDPPLMPEEVSDSVFSLGNWYRILDVETVLILDWFWTMSTFKCAISGAFLLL